MHITAEDQRKRFEKRLDDPARQWKISEADYKERAYFERYVRAYEDVLAKTSTAHAPWFVIPSKRKWFRNLAVSKIVVETLKSFDMKVPPPTVNIEEIRREFHADEAKEKS